MTEIACKVFNGIYTILSEGCVNHTDAILDAPFLGHSRDD